MGLLWIVVIMVLSVVISAVLAILLIGRHGPFWQPGTLAHGAAGAGSHQEPSPADRGDGDPESSGVDDPSAPEDSAPSRGGHGEAAHPSEAVPPTGTRPTTFMHELR